MTAPGGVCEVAALRGRPEDRDRGTHGGGGEEVTVYSERLGTWRGWGRTGGSTASRARVVAPCPGGCGARTSPPLPSSVARPRARARAGPPGRWRLSEHLLWWPDGRRVAVARLTAAVGTERRGEVVAGEATLILASGAGAASVPAMGQPAWHAGARAGPQRPVRPTTPGVPMRPGTIPPWGMGLTLGDQRSGGRLNVPALVQPRRRAGPARLHTGVPTGDTDRLIRPVLTVTPRTRATSSSCVMRVETPGRASTSPSPTPRSPPRQAEPPVVYETESPSVTPSRPALSSIGAIAQGAQTWMHLCAVFEDDEVHPRSSCISMVIGCTSREGARLQRTGHLPSCSPTPMTSGSSPMRGTPLPTPR